MGYILDQIAIAVDRSMSGGTDLDTSVAFTIQYIGSEASGTVTVSSGDFTFQHGASGAEAVDATIDSGGDDPGVIDVSDTNANSNGEIIDLINASVNWRAKIKGTVRDDLPANLDQTVAETQAKVAGGIPITFDGSVGIYSVAITGNEFRSLASNPGFDDGAYDDKGCINGLAYVTATVTETGGATLKVIEASDADTTATWNELYSIAIADSTAQAVGNSASPYNELLHVSDENKRLIVRITAATSLDTLEAFNLRGCTVDLRRGRVIS